jgi:hypothetical protein
MDEFFDDEAEEGEEEAEYLNEGDNVIDIEDEDKEYLNEGSNE